MVGAKEHCGSFSNLSDFCYICIIYIGTHASHLVFLNSAAAVLLHAVYWSRLTYQVTLGPCRKTAAVSPSLLNKKRDADNVYCC